MSRSFEEGIRVRLDIPNESDPDYERLHGQHGKITSIIENDAGAETGDPQDSGLFRVQLDKGDKVDVRHRDLRPPIEKE